MAKYPQASEYIKNMCATINGGIKKGVTKFKIMPTPYLEGDASAFLIATAIESEFKRMGQDVRFEYGREGIWFYITVNKATWGKRTKKDGGIADGDELHMKVVLLGAMGFCHAHNIGYVYFDEFRRKVTKWIKSPSHDFDAKEKVMLEKYRYHGKVKQAEIRNVAAFCKLLQTHGFSKLDKWNRLRKAIDKQLSEEYDMEMERMDARDQRIAEERIARKRMDEEA